jgi:hypothetical protein
LRRDPMARDLDDFVSDARHVPTPLSLTPT